MCSSNLDAAGAQTQQQLADALGMHRNNMVGLIDEMEAGGWVRRHRSEQDRRAFDIKLTAAGRRILGRVQGSISALEATLSAELTAAEHRAIVKLLRRVAAGLELSPGVHPHLGGRR